MKKWLKFFCLSFFSHNISKEAVKRSYTNAFLGFILVLIFLWTGFIGGDMLPFGVHYHNAPDFMATVRSALIGSEEVHPVEIKIENGNLKARKQGAEYYEGLLVNTLENDTDRQNYSTNGYNLIIDTRPAGTPAEVEVYCLSNDGKETVISYQDYLGLSEVARLNFDFKLKYTGKELILTDDAVKEYREYVDGLDNGSKEKAEEIAGRLSEGQISKDEYDLAIYELYFENYYPRITEYEESSKIPLLRNYYYHQYISRGESKYLFIFDDYMAGSFETKGGNAFSFYGFYDGMDEGIVVDDGATEEEAIRSVDNFIKTSFNSIFLLNSYAYAMNVISLAPFIALMLMVATLLTYSILKLRLVESITTLGAMLKIVGSFLWLSGAASTLLTIIIAFFVERSMITALPLVLFFIVLAIRSVIFAIMEGRAYFTQLEQQTEQGEV